MVKKISVFPSGSGVRMFAPTKSVHHFEKQYKKHPDWKERTEIVYIIWRHNHVSRKFLVI